MMEKHAAAGAAAANCKTNSHSVQNFNLSGFMMALTSIGSICRSLFHSTVKYFALVFISELVFWEKLFHIYQKIDYHIEQKISLLRQVSLYFLYCYIFDFIH